MNYRFLALIRKEFAQIRRDRRLAMSLILPPTVQLLLFSFVLNATVSDLKIGIIDDSRTPESRALTSTFSESKTFRLTGYYYSVDKLGDAISRGEVDAGVVIPLEYARDLQQGRPVTVQLLLNAINANTAAIAQGYAEGVIQSFNRGLAAGGLHARVASLGAPAGHGPGHALLTATYLYNPGLVGSWFVATGIFGLLLILNGSIVAATSMVRERETGTLEQLLMSPASTTEIILAKMAPLFLLLLMVVVLALGMMKVAFHILFHGSITLVLCGASLCVLSGIGLGTVIATFTHSAQQAQLTSFFVNPLLTTVSGAITPSEAIPRWLRPLASINPIHHFSVIARSALIKGSGFEMLWPNFLALLTFTVILVSLSVWRFRNQLS